MAFDNQTNRGRVAKIVEILGLLETSCAANPFQIEEFRDVTGPALAQFERWANMAAHGSPEPRSPDVPVEQQEPTETAPVARETALGNLAELSTQQLVDRMIACGAELAKRRQ